MPGEKSWGKLLLALNTHFSLTFVSHFTLTSLRVWRKASWRKTCQKPSAESVSQRNTSNYCKSPHISVGSIDLETLQCNLKLVNTKIPSFFYFSFQELKNTISRGKSNMLSQLMKGTISLKGNRSNQHTLVVSGLKDWLESFWHRYPITVVLIVLCCFDLWQMLQ